MGPMCHADGLGYYSRLQLFHKIREAVCNSWVTNCKKLVSGCEVDCH